MLIEHRRIHSRSLALPVLPSAPSHNTDEPEFSNMSKPRLRFFFLLLLLPFFLFSSFLRTFPAHSPASPPYFPFQLRQILVQWNSNSEV